VKTILFFV